MELQKNFDENASVITRILDPSQPFTPDDALDLTNSITPQIESPLTLWNLFRKRVSPRLPFIAVADLPECGVIQLYHEQSQPICNLQGSIYFFNRTPQNPNGPADFFYGYAKSGNGGCFMVTTPLMQRQIVPPFGDVGFYTPVKPPTCRFPNSASARWFESLGF